MHSDDFILGDDGAVGITGDSGDPFEAEDAAADRSRRESEASSAEVSQLVAAVFGQGRGPELLALLAEMTYRNPCFMPGGLTPSGASQALDAVQMGFYREGENGMVRWIETCIQQARQ